VFTWLHKLRDWVGRIRSWLWHGRPLWLLLIVPSAVFYASYLAFASWETRLRMTGLGLELGGVATVAMGFYETRKLFQRRSWFAWLRSWLESFPAWNTSHRAIVGAGHLAVQPGNVNLKYTAAPPPNATIEQRVAALETNMVNVTEAMHAIRADLESTIVDQNQQLEHERRQRTDQDVSLRELITEAAAGGLTLEATGITWLVLGLILGTAASEIASLWQ
jgi:hypothetical protein